MPGDVLDDARPDDGRPVVLLARHGETEWNRAGRMQGQRDVALSARGLEQAAALARRLADERPARLVSSDLVRAGATADAVGRALGLPVVLDPRLREEHLGSWQGLTFEEAAARDPDLAHRFKARDANARPPGGETRAELQSRAWSALEDLAAPGSAGPLVLVTHGGVIQSLVYRVLGLPLSSPRRFRLPNVGLTTLVHDRANWFLRTLNDVSHCGPATDSFPFD